jgi:transcriptional regulator with XRE-family HTH domain
MSPAQCRAARGLLNWSQTELGEHAGIGLKVIADFERGATKRPHRLNALVAAMEAAGIEFIRRGVRMRARPKTKWGYPMPRRVVGLRVRRFCALGRDLNDDGMMEQPVEQRGCNDGIAEHVSPFGEATVWGEDHRVLFVASVAELEE